MTALLNFTAFPLVGHIFFSDNLHFSAQTEYKKLQAE